MSIEEIKTKAKELMLRMCGDTREFIKAEVNVFSSENKQILMKAFNCAENELGDKIADEKGFE